MVVGPAWRRFAKTENAMKSKTWLWILLGIVAVTFAGCLALVGTGIYVVRKNVDVKTATVDTAQDEFARVRTQFADQEPLVMIDGRDHTTPDLERRLKEATPPRQPLTAMHVMVYQEKEGKLMRFSLPMWLIRRGNRQSFNVDAGGMQLDRLNISPEDLERLGPTLIVDHRERDSRVLVWTE
jgi:hypothetical protein